MNWRGEVARSLKPSASKGVLTFLLFLVAFSVLIDATLMPNPCYEECKQKRENALMWSSVLSPAPLLLPLFVGQSFLTFLVSILIEILYLYLISGFILSLLGSVLSTLESLIKRVKK
jgi:hypothetical protein